MICPRCFRADVPALPGEPWRTPHPRLVAHVAARGEPCQNAPGKLVPGIPSIAIVEVWCTDGAWDL